MGRLLVAFVCIALLAFTVITVYDIPLTGMATLSVKVPLVSLRVPGVVTVGDPMVGDLVMNFSGPASARAVVRFMLGSDTKDFSLSSLLGNASIPIVVQDRSLEALNPSVVKSLTFAGAGDQSLALRLPKSADVKSVTFSVEGVALDGVLPSRPSVDIGADGFKEFEYVGNLSGWGAIVYPHSFSNRSESSIVVKDDARYYCELLNLSQAKDFEFGVKYGPHPANNSGNISLSVFSFAGAGSSVTISGGADGCDLPEVASVGVNSCRVALQNPISSNYMVCVTNSVRTNQNKNVYALMTDQEVSSTSYSCQFFAGAGSCSAVGVGHFSVGVRAGQYVGRLSSKMLLRDAATQYGALESLKKELLSCVPVNDFCTIPLVVASQSKGKVFLSDVVIGYVSQGVDKEEKSLYDVDQVSEWLSVVDNVNLVQGNVSVVVPLEDLGLIPLKADAGKNISLKVAIDGVTKSSVAVRVEKALAVNSTLARIDRVKSSLNGLDKSLLASLGLKSSFTDTLSSLDALRRRVVALEDNVSADKSSVFADIVDDVDVLLADIPVAVREVSRVADTILVSPADLAGFANADALALVQKAYTVKGVIRVMEVEYYNGDTVVVSRVEKQVTGSLSGVRLAERFLSGVVDPLDVVIDGGSLVDDYIVFPAKSSFSYVVPGDVSFSLSDLKTIVLAAPKLVDEVAAVQYVCGDNKCTSIKVNDQVLALEDAISCPVDCTKKFPYTLFIVMFIVVVVGLYYIYVYHGPGALFRKAPSSPTFRTKLDEINLVGYVRKTLEKKLDRSKVEPVLVAKGWEKKQIDFAFKEALKQLAASKPVMKK